MNARSSDDAAPSGSDGTSPKQINQYQEAVYIR
jgi:hypothetical protein